MSTDRAPIRILSVDDHPLLREGIAALLAGQSDMKLVAEASNGREAIEQFRMHRPDVTLMDLQMPEMNGVDAMIAICGEFPGARGGSKLVPGLLSTKTVSVGEPGTAVGAGATQRNPGAKPTTLTLTGNGSGIVTLSGVISIGGGGKDYAITKSGTSTFTLSGANTYGGTTTISGGVLNIQNATALGSTASGTTVAAGADGVVGQLLQVELARREDVNLGVLHPSSLDAQERELAGVIRKFHHFRDLQ